MFNGWLMAGYLAGYLAGYVAGIMLGIVLLHVVTSNGGTMIDNYQACLGLLITVLLAVLV